MFKDTLYGPGKLQTASVQYGKVMQTGMSGRGRCSPFTQPCVQADMVMIVFAGQKCCLQTKVWSVCGEVKPSTSR